MGKKDTSTTQYTHTCLENIQIVNPNRERPVHEFRDRARSVAKRYHESYEQEFESDEDIERILRAFIKEDSHFFDPYAELSDMFWVRGNLEEASKMLHKAFEGAVGLIVDKNGTWPDALPWSWVENRHIIRAIDIYAHELWEDGCKKCATEIYRRLFRSDPEDHTGARFALLSLLLDLSPHWEEDIYPGALPGVVDGAGLDEWFEQNAKQFPDEFNWWLSKE